MGNSEQITLYTLDETADILKVSRRTVQTFIADGRLKATKVGERLVRINKLDLQTFLDGGRD